MKLRRRGIRQVFGTCLSALIVALSVAVPVMGRGDLSRGNAVESQHDPVNCAPAHNHTLCTQVGANHALTSRQDLRVGVAPFVGSPVAGELHSAFVPVMVTGHRTRAPPSV